MSQQGERSGLSRHDRQPDWWSQLYDDNPPDAGRPLAAGDTLDERFASASHTLGSPRGAPLDEKSAPPEEPWWQPRPGPEPGQGPTPGSTSGRRPAPQQQPAPGQDPAPGPGPASPERDPGSGPGPASRRERAPERSATPGPGLDLDLEPGTGTDQNPNPEPTAGPNPELDSRSAPEPDPERAPRPDPGPATLLYPAPSRKPKPGQDREPEPYAESELPTAQPSAAAAFTVGHVGDRPPTYDPEPSKLPATDPADLVDLVQDTVLDGASYGTWTLRALSMRGDSARYRGESRRDALLTARFGTGENALLLVAIAGATRAVPADDARRAARDACHWIGGAIGRSHARLAEDIRAGRRTSLKSGLHRLTDRGFGKLRAKAAELGIDPAGYSADLRCLLLPADPACRMRVFFGAGAGGLFRLRDGVWEDIEPSGQDGTISDPVLGFGAPPPGYRLDHGAGAGGGAGPGAEVGAEVVNGNNGGSTAATPSTAAGPDAHATGSGPASSPAAAPAPLPFRFRASVAQPGDMLLLCGAGLADPLRAEAAFAEQLADEWSGAGAEPPGLAAFLAAAQLRIKGYADDRTAAAVWEA